MIYCIDTSAWRDGWVRDYPPDVFPSLWEKLAACIAAGELKCSEEVYVELEKKVCAASPSWKCSANWDGSSDFMSALNESIVEDAALTWFLLRRGFGEQVGELAYSLGHAGR